MGDVHDSDHEVVLDAANLELQFLAQAPIERPKRFIHQHQARLEHQLPGDGDALLLAAGKLSLAPVLETFEANDLKRLSDALDPAFHGATVRESLLGRGDGEGPNKSPEVTTQV